MTLFRLIQRAKASLGGSISALRPSNALALAIIFFASTQLGLHLWPSSALVYGVRVDYLAPTFYFLDILIMVYFLIKSLDHSIKINNYKLKIILPLLLTNLLFSSNPLATLAWSFHIVLYLLFVLSLSKRLITYSLFLIPLTTSLQLVLALFQVGLGHSLGGPLYYLGERLVSLGQPGIASGTLFGNLVLRAYGTFSHPNVLAGWLVVSLLTLLTLAPRQRRGSLLWLATAITTLGVLLTQSRTAALSLFGLIIPFHLIRSVRSRLIYIIILLCSLFTIQYSSSFSRPLDLAVSERLSLQKLSLNIIAAYPIFGTGASSSITTYPVTMPSFRLLQPDHNSLTLFLSWFGLFGILYLFSTVKSNKISLSPISYLLFPIFPLLLLDHYLLTSPQGLFILVFYLRVVNLSHAQKNSH